MKKTHIPVKSSSKKHYGLPVNARADRNGNYHFNYIPANPKLLQIHCAKIGVPPDAITLI